MTRMGAEERNVPFTLDRENLHWNSSEGLRESDFPWIANVDGRCDELFQELYSDETFAEAGTDWTD